MLILLSLMSTVIITQTACNNSTEVNPVEQEGYYLDTVCRVSVYEINGGLDEKEANAAIDAAYERCRALDKTLTRTVAASEVSRINAAGGAWVEIGSDTIAVLNAGIRYGALSDGRFDITIGTVSELWDFHSEDPKVPAQADLDEALRHVDYRKIEIDGNRVRLLDPAAKLDLGGIAKGYIADEMTKVLEEKGVTSAIVNLGGNIVAIGEKPGGGAFVVGIEKPYSDRTEIVGSTGAKNESVVTSGVYERQFKKDGKVYHHILSSETGYPVETDLDAVSLVAEKGRSMDIDAMSTIALVLGAEEGRKFLAAEKIEAVFCLRDGSVKKTKGMDFTKE